MGKKAESDPEREKLAKLLAGTPGITDECRERVLSTYDREKDDGQGAPDLLEIETPRL